MSTSTIPPEPVLAVPADAAEWVPAPESLYRMRVGKFEEMVASGVFTKRGSIAVADFLPPA
jgi:hypothetical protein